MSDTPKQQPPPLPVSYDVDVRELGRMRSKAPSWHDLASEITQSHTINSDPPGVRWLDRRTGRAIRLGVHWLLRSKYAWAIWSVTGVTATALLEKCTHVLGH